MLKILFSIIYVSLITSLVVFSQIPKLAEFSFIPLISLGVLIIAYRVTNKDVATNDHPETADGGDSSMFNECSGDFGDAADGDCGGDSDGGDGGD